MPARTLLVALLAALAWAAAAHASGMDVIRDCTDDEIMSKTYTQKEYRAALRELAADADQYGNCRDVILRAQQAALAANKRASSAAGSGGPTAGGGSAPAGGAGAIGSAPVDEQLGSASETERAALQQARTTPGSPVSIDDGTVDPTQLGTVPGISAVSDLPLPLAVLVALLLAGTLALAGHRIRRLVHARRA